MLSQNDNSSVTYGVGDIETLQKLIISAKQGDADAFTQVYTQLYTPLYRYTISRCKDPELAKDVCQQTFLNFYKALPNYEPQKSPLAYLFTIAKRLLINHHDKNKVLDFDDEKLEFKEEESSTIEDAHVKHLVESIAEYLPSLTYDEQECIRLFYFGELEYKEISEIMQKEEPALRKIKERALKKLRLLTSHLYVEQ